MKTAICDVCYWRDKQLKFSTSRYRLRQRNPDSTTTSLSYDLCDEHKEFFESCKSLEEAIERAQQMGFEMREVGT